MVQLHHTDAAFATLTGLMRTPSPRWHHLWAVLIARINEVFPSLWDDGDAQLDDGVQIEPDWDLAAQPASDFEVDQRISW